ncbi:MAG: hypothetical protein JWP89_4719 [Schlesneria sp.]|nr:hypothetical protein [Schlesneria sp.]
MSQQWMYRAFQQEFGPLSFENLIELAKIGTITADDEVKMGLDGKWRRAGSIGRLVAVLPFAAPTKPASTAKPKSTDSLPAAEAPRPTRPKSAPVVAAPAAKPAIEQQSAPVRPKSNPIVATADSPVKEPPKPLAKSAPSIPVPVSDAEIIAGAREALTSRNLPGLTRIELESHEGVVIARGTLNSEGERLLAIRVLQQTPGVIKVIDALSLTQTKVTPRSLPVIKAMPAPKVSRHAGSSAMSQFIDNLKGEYRNHAISAAVAAALLGFWFYPSGPSRPVAVHPVKGKVIMDGQPLANAAIVLHRVGESKLPANLHPRGKATADGSFALETFDAADGAPEGEFVATVFLNEETEVDGEKMAGPNILPTVYSRPETSPFKIRITSSTKELQPLELTKG